MALPFSLRCPTWLPLPCASVSSHPFHPYFLSSMCFPYCPFSLLLLRYTSEETPMSHYLNIHDVLDARRQEALKAKGQGPRTIVVGPTGAHTVCL